MTNTMLSNSTGNSASNLTDQAFNLSETPSALYAHTPIVLVVDDEAIIREVVSDILEAEGLTILEAENGEAGIAKVRQHAGAIRVVVLDMKMPGLSGYETLRILHEIDPTLKILLSSGYGEDEIGTMLQSSDTIDLLPKPYKMEQLVLSVRRALGPTV